MAKGNRRKKGPELLTYSPAPTRWARYPSNEWVAPEEMLRFFNELVERMAEAERESRRVTIDAIRRAINEQSFLMRDKQEFLFVREAARHL